MADGERVIIAHRPGRSVTRPASEGGNLSCTRSRCTIGTVHDNPVPVRDIDHPSLASTRHASAAPTHPAPRANHPPRNVSQHAKDTPAQSVDAHRPDGQRFGGGLQATGLSGLLGPRQLHRAPLTVRPSREISSASPVTSVQYLR